jgi:hypothetical protein
VVSDTPRPLYPRERPGTHCTAGCVDLRASLDCCGKPRFSTRFRTPDRPTLSQLLFQPRYRGLHVGRIHRSYSITLKIEAGCYSEVLILQFIIWEFGRRMDKPCSGVCYVFFFSYLLLCVCPWSTATTRNAAAERVLWQIVGGVYQFCCVGRTCAVRLKYGSVTLHMLVTCRETCVTGRETRAITMWPAWIWSGHVLSVLSARCITTAHRVQKCNTLS